MALGVVGGDERSRFVLLTSLHFLTITGGILYDDIPLEFPEIIGLDGGSRMVCHRTRRYICRFCKSNFEFSKPIQSFPN